MAEAAASALVKVIFEKLADEALKRYVRSQGLNSELESLGRELSQIQAVLDDASQKEIKDEAVKQWLNDLQHLAYDIDDVLDDVATEAMHHQLTSQEESGASTSKVRKLIPNCFAKLSLSNRLSPKLDSITNELQQLEKQKLRLGLIEKADNPKNNDRGDATSLLETSVVGREGEQEKLLERLFGDDESSSSKENFSILPIVGMGGVGKTTLARLLYNDVRVKDHFELKAWVCVSDDFDISKITKTIFQDVSGETKEFEDLNQVQMALKQKLKDKRFLLVLDDVWTENYERWENLVLPFYSGAPGSRIIMTTRKDKLLKKIGFDHLDHLKSLSHEVSLSLFALHAMGVENFHTSPTLKTKGESIVKKCGGLPLALKAIGRLLRTKTDGGEWDAVLKSEIWDLENVDEIVPALRLSYHDLSVDLKRLFAYCSLFPKDFLFDKEELVLLWMAEGFLNQSNATKSLEWYGHEYFEALLSRSFFQHAPNEESLFVMHDLMNDLGSYVSGDFFLRFDNHMDMEKEALTKYRHMSFMREEYVSYPKFKPFKRAKGLRTFLAISVGVVRSWKHFYLSNKIIDDLLSELPFLRVLSLSRFDISEVPKLIGDLKHLRYLNLSHTKIEVLPENVGNLYNLQTLIVFGCHYLTKLPKSFSMLKKLRHLDIGDTPLLEKFPLGVGELKNLHTLTKIIIRDSGFAISELKVLNNLHGKNFVKGLRGVQSAHEAKLSLKGLTKIKLDWSDGSQQGTLEKNVLDEMKPDNNKLEELVIVSYGGVEFSNWVGDPSFHLLVYLSLTNCGNCTSLPPLGQLPLLRELFIQGMDEVEVIGSELTGTTGVAFPSLKILVFKDMLRWKVWSTNKGLDALFPCLQNLHIENCPELIDISLKTRPSVEIIKVEDISGREVSSTNDEVLDVMFPCLIDLYIHRCPSLVDISLKALPSLKVLEICGCGVGVLRSLLWLASSVSKLVLISIFGLTDEVWRGVIKYLRVVEEVVIHCCDEIRHLWESEAVASKVLMNLKKLKVAACSNLVSLGKKEDDGDKSESNFLLSLRMLDVQSCNNLEHCCCPNNLESLFIYHCDSVTRISFPTTETGGGGQKLKSLKIGWCKKLMGNINNTSLPMIEEVSISCWRNQKSIVQLSNSIHLTSMSITDCPSIELFPDIQLPNLTYLKINKCQSMKRCPDTRLPSLTTLVIQDCESLESLRLSQLTLLEHLEITNCPSIDASFHRGLWPPNLSYLIVGRLKTPISNWDYSDFPSSLVDLWLYGEPYLSNFSQLSNMFPSCLTELRIDGFDKLESLSKGLQHLTSLQHLCIYNCPKMKHLPETLLPSLLSLKIRECANLSHRCNRRSSRYWPLISHIPCIQTDDTEYRGCLN